VLNSQYQITRRIQTPVLLKNKKIKKKQHPNNKKKKKKNSPAVVFMPYSQLPGRLK
jgi:hypothetical protein